MCVPFNSAAALDNIQARAFAGRDVHIEADKLINYQGVDNVDVLVVENKFSITAGADTFTGNRAVVWIKRGQPIDGAKKTSIWACVSGRVTAARGKGTRIPGLNWQLVENGRAMIVWFEATGDVFLTAQSKEVADVRQGEFYASAFAAVAGADKEFADRCKTVSPPRKEPPPAPVPVPAPEAARIEPNLAKPSRLPAPITRKPEQARPPAREVAPAEQPSGALGFIERLFGPPKTTQPVAPQAKIAAAKTREKIRYPVNLAPAGVQEPNIESARVGARDIATIIGRFYLWQRQDESGRLLELQADAAVAFYSQEKIASADDQAGLKDIAAQGGIVAIYVRGDVVMSEGLRTIRADEMYYDFVAHKGLAINASIRTFDPDRGIPIYIRAAKVRRLAENQFAADNVVLTTSEFYVPQISVQASNVLVTDNTTIEQEAPPVKDSSYDVQMRDVRLKTDDTTIFYWPFMRSNLERPDVPLKSINVGHDEIFGTNIETKWYLSRLLGLREPEGTDETFDIDYYSKRGLGVGTEVDYAQESRLGHIIGYIIDDRGKDRLGRVAFRRDLEPPEELRGRFGWVHREFMPYNWQLTTGINYESDEHFVESYYRREFNTGPPRETYIHLKRIEDNWGVAILGKGRLNNFEDELDESPTIEYHLTGQSLFDDKLTLYSDTYGGRFKQLIGRHHTTDIRPEHFTFVSHRTELDMPVWTGGVKVVPFVAGTVGYDDRSGFNRSLVNGSNSGDFGEDTVGIGEAGVRASTQYWNTYPGVKSRLWDLNGLRHIIRPEVAMSLYAESDDVVKQHNVIYTGISQRLQTKRGPADNQRSVDWMRLDLGGTWFADNDPKTDGSGPYRFIWNRPMTPLRLFAMPGILDGDLASGLKQFETYGPHRDYLSADYSWQISDTTAFLSDAFYDVHAGTLEQVDTGFSRTVWPDLSYYVGTRYLRDVKVLKQHGSNPFIFAATYVLDPRYTIVFSQQYDFDYGANVESNITLIRRYNRMYWSFTYSADGSLGRQGIMFSVWPQGIPEFALGTRRYTALSGPGGY
jgi:hypothetical protein